MNIMVKEAEGRYTVTLENGDVFHGVPCIGAYDSEMEVIRDLCDSNDHGGKGIFNDKAHNTGVIFYYTDEPDTSKYVFTKAQHEGKLIWETVFKVED